MKNRSDIHQWAIPHRVAFEEGPEGLTRIAVTTSAARANVFLHGAHVAHFQPTDSAPILFMSASSCFAKGKPIRGGVPVIFPWFGPRSDRPGSPPHGFARTTDWELESVENIDEANVTLLLRLDSNAATRAVWPHDFVLRHRITIGAQLRMALEVENRSAGDLRFEEALHTYFAVSDVRNVRISGLAGAEYIDKVDGAKRKLQGSEPIRINGETDRVHLGTRATCSIEDSGLARRITIEKSGSDSTVVWNPWSAKAATMPDFGDDEWPKMLCVETANVADNAMCVAPGATHTMQVRIAAT